ncbi:MAG: Nif3-like dinuclear metal center hexameric protein, partial [Clostridia bacterium]|nr:Nif3-like dinuclear metal center hexameric protein [Clostridia bacterium]
TLDTPTPLADFANQVKERLRAPHLLVGDAHRPALRVALVGGAGKDSIAAAIAAGADTLVSGELGYHALTDAESYGINLVEAGHYFTEQQILTRFGALLSELAPELPYEIYDSNRILSV